MLADLLAYASCNLDQIACFAIGVSLLQKTIAVRWINMKEHWASEMLDIEYFEERVPSSHPLICGCIEHERIDLLPASHVRRAGYLAVPTITRSYLVAVFLHPMQPLMLVICKQC